MSLPSQPRELPQGARPVRILGVDYIHVVTSDGGDLYYTKHGLHHMEHLRPENWREDAWFRDHRERLKGTSTVYRVTTREVHGHSVPLVVKWCRVGERVPIDTFGMNSFIDAEFNSPYEEFSLVMEMREVKSGPRVLTHRPLAIYVPSERLQLWQTRRSQSTIARKKTKYHDVELDIYRQYILIYEWIKGESADEVLEKMTANPDERTRLITELTWRANDELRQRGYTVLDHKPAHMILRRKEDGSLLMDASNRPAYAMVDFELLARTPEHEQRVRAERRHAYLVSQTERFKGQERPLPDHLHAANIFGVDFVSGYADSTQGLLWVVGKDPDLFDYFLPERWRRTPRQALSETNQTYYTLSKDGINLVWKVSRVGEQPEVSPGNEQGARILDVGYNSPFEEIAYALELARRGMATTYPRAVYMIGLSSGRSHEYVQDNRRYASHKNLHAFNSKPILRKAHPYLTIWGLWNGLDELIAGRDEPYCAGVDLRQAVVKGIVTPEESRAVLEKKRDHLLQVGYEDVGLKPTHILVTVTKSGRVFRDDDGIPSPRLCNFSMIRRIKGHDDWVI